MTCITSSIGVSDIVFTIIAKKTILPSLKYFITLVRDELKIKYIGNRFQRYAESLPEAGAILWMRQEMGWSQTIPERMPGRNQIPTQ